MSLIFLAKIASILHRILVRSLLVRKFEIMADSNTYLPIIPLDSKPGKKPYYLQIARFLVEEIKSGKLKEDVLLPGYRELAKFLLIDGSTVLRAYRYLRGKGWLKNKPGRSYYVSLGEERRGELQALESHPPPLTDTRSWNADVIFPRPHRPMGFKWTAPDEPEERGTLEDTVQEYVNLEMEYGFLRENIFIHSGCEHIFSTVAGHVVRGRMVMVAMPCDPSILAALRNIGATIIPFSVWKEDGGFSVKKLDFLIRFHKFVSALVLDSQHLQMIGQSPSAEAAEQMIRLSETFGFLIWEHHSSSRELYFGNSPKAIILSDELRERVIHTGYLSELIMPLNTIGIVCAPAPLIDKLKTYYRCVSITGNDFYVDLVHAHIRQRSYLLRQVSLKRSYLYLRRKVQKLLQEYIGEFVHFEIPPDGLACWLSLKAGLPLRETYKALNEAGLRLGHPRTYGKEETYPDMLLFGFAQLHQDELHEILDLMRNVLEEVRSRHAPPN